MNKILFAFSTLKSYFCIPPFRIFIEKEIKDIEIRKSAMESPVVEVRIMDVYNDEKENEEGRGGQGRARERRATSGGDKEPDRTDEGTLSVERGWREGREAAVKL